jgi:hypothetical protein
MCFYWYFYFASSCSRHLVMLDHLPRPDFGAVDVALHIKGDISAALAPLRCGGSGMRCVSLPSFRAPMRMSRSQPGVRLKT